MSSLLKESTAAHTQPTKAYVFGPFRLEAASFELRRDGQLVALTKKQFNTLLFLLDHRNRVISKDELMEAVWPDASVTEDSLTQCISCVRRALSDDPAQPHFIATVARRGYRFVAPVTEIAETTEPVALAPTENGAAGWVRPVPLEGSEPTAHAGSRVTFRAMLWPMIAVASLFAGWLVLGRVWPVGVAPPDASPGPLLFTQHAPPATRLVSGGALSPDSRHLAFVAEDEAGTRQLWIRTLAAQGPRPLDGTEGASRPFWSPDSQSIGFFANGQLKTSALGGGQPGLIATVGAVPAGGTWTTTGQIIFANFNLGLYSVSASGGNVATIRAVDRSAGERGYGWPYALPDGVHFLYAIGDWNPGGSAGGIYVGRLGSPERVRLLDIPTAAIYAPPGYLVYSRQRILMAHPFDATRLQFTGEPTGIASEAPDPLTRNGTMFSASAQGLLSFGGGGDRSKLAWFNRRGEKLGQLSTPTPLHNPALSPDEKFLFGAGFNQGQRGIWVVDLQRGASNWLIRNASAPIISSDGSQLAFSFGELGTGLYVRSTGGGEGDELLTRTTQWAITDDWSQDGRYIVYETITPESGRDLWLIPRFGDRQPTPFLQNAANETQGRVSPDGRWIAYASDESGSWEVYVQSFPRPGNRQTISTGGGAQPQWRRDGLELFYLSADRSLMAVDVKPGPTLEVTKPNALFRIDMTVDLNTYRNQYAVSRDAQRFLVDVTDEEAGDPISVLLNWHTRHPAASTGKIIAAW